MQAYLQGSVVMTLFGLLDPQGVNLLQGFNHDLIVIDTWPAISSGSPSWPTQGYLFCSSQLS